MFHAEKIEPTHFGSGSPRCLHWIHGNTRNEKSLENTLDSDLLKVVLCVLFLNPLFGESMNRNLVRFGSTVAWIFSEHADI